MRLKNIFKNISSKKLAGIAIATTGGVLLLVDSFRLAHGDVSVFGGTSLAAAFAAHATTISAGLSLIPGQENKQQKIYVVEGFRPTN